jgi:hypothetical protein
MQTGRVVRLPPGGRRPEGGLAELPHETRRVDLLIQFFRYVQGGVAALDLEVDQRVDPLLISPSPFAVNIAIPNGLICPRLP